MSLSDEKVSRLQEVIDLAKRFLPLNIWNFKQSTHLFVDSFHPVVIYNSEKCRIKVVYEAVHRHEDRSINVFYGRLDVPDNADSLHSKDRGNYHLYWHSIYFSLPFLDGLSPREARAEKAPRLIREFEQSKVVKDIVYQPEKTLVMHATIWASCGQQLFDLFDVRNKSLWEQYSTFTREFWETLPPLDSKGK